MRYNKVLLIVLLSTLVITWGILGHMIFNHSSNETKFDFEEYCVLLKKISDLTKVSILEQDAERYIDSLELQLKELEFVGYNIQSKKIADNFYLQSNESVDKFLTHVVSLNSKEKIFCIELLRCLSLQQILITELQLYYPFNRLTIFPPIPINGDTIYLGEEYHAAIPCYGTNLEHPPLFITNKDTIEFQGGITYFQEKTTRRGKVVHDGYLQLWEGKGKNRKYPLKIEYYVK
jgi:hypothetical protein